MRDVYIIGVGMTRFFRWLDRSIKDLANEAVSDALTHAGIEKQDIEAAWFANSTWGFLQGQDQVRGQVALGAMGIHKIPITNVESACGGGSQALHNAWLGVSSGAYECALAVGAEKLYDADKRRSFQAIETGTDRENRGAIDKLWINRIHELGIDVPLDNFEKAGVDRGGMMNFYACMVRWHMMKYGTTQRHLALITSKAHRLGAMNPKAQFQKAMTIEDVLAARPVVYPLTVPMCAPLGDGSAAAVLCSEDFLRRMTSPKPVKILASVYGSNTPRAFDESEKAIEVRLSQKAYNIAGVGPEDVDVLEVHDAASYGELKMTEQLGFCGPGEGGPFAESGATMLGGKIPVNPSGGLISRGHPLAATGIAQIYELVTQLRGEAGARQVEGARIGMSENGGGMVYFEEASMGIHILERPAKQ
ncbi:MAG: acetyl-CoA acetyltransferase [Syntrophorhabdus sp. PtaU1.Bin058]|nr:MAG: acetyl-CoA acetyltransferase [Syntrophorhabdus sp. PtaU1.Bin058]